MYANVTFLFFKCFVHFMVHTDYGLTDHSNPMLILGLNKQRFLQIHVIMYCNPFEFWK